MDKQLSILEEMIVQARLEKYLNALRHSLITLSEISTLHEDIQALLKAKDFDVMQITIDDLRSTPKWYDDNKLLALVDFVRGAGLKFDAYNFFNKNNKGEFKNE